MCSPELRDKHVEIISEINATILSQRAKCVDSDNDNAICSLEEAKQKYNQTLAKLVIAKGLDALKQDLEVSYKGVQNLTSKKINDAIKAVDDFESALIKTEILSESLKLKDGKRALEFVDKDNIDFANTLKNECTTTEDQQSSSYCRSLQTLSVDQKEKTIEFVEGFIESFHVAYPDERDHDLKYSDMLKTLSLNIDGTTTDVLSFKESQDYKNIQRIKDRLKVLLTSKDESSAKEIVTLSSSLKNLKANFGNKVVALDPIIENIKEYIENDLNNLSNAYTVLTKAEPVKENLNQTVKLIDAQTQMSFNALSRELKTNFSTDCQDKSTSDCISYLKQTSPSQASSVISRHKKIIESDKYGIVLKKAQLCFNNKNANIEKAECIEKIKENFPSMFNGNISELEGELEKAKNTIADFSKKLEISNLEKIKIDSLIALKENGCLEETETSINCNNTNSFDIVTLNLSTSVQNAIAQISIEDYKKLSEYSVKKDMLDEKSLEIDPELDEDESDGPNRVIATNSTSTSTNENVKLTTEQKKKFKKSNRQILRAERIERRELRWAKNESKRKGSSGSSYFMSGLSSSISQGVPKIMAQAQQRNQIRYERQQRQQYYDYYIQSMQNYNSYGNGLYMNWGANGYNPYYGNNFNYGNNNLYYGANYNQYTYGSDNISNTYFNSSSTGNSSSNTTTSPFSFSFSQN